jgi:hypothetical protein
MTGPTANSTMDQTPMSPNDEMAPGARHRAMTARLEMAPSIFRCESLTRAPKLWPTVGGASLRGSDVIAAEMDPVFDDQ